MSDDRQAELEAGLRLFRLGDFHQAAMHFSFLVDENPGIARALGYLGMSQIKLGMVQRGIAALQDAARLQPQDAATQYNLGVALLQTQQPAAARIALQRSLAIDPGHSAARAALAEIGGDGPASPESALAGSGSPADLVQTAGPAAGGWTSYGAAGSEAPCGAAGGEQAEAAPTPGQPTPSFQQPGNVRVDLAGNVYPAAPFQQPDAHIDLGGDPQPAAYTPRSFTQGQPPPGVGYGARPGAPGMQYNPFANAEPEPRVFEPPFGLRIARGAGWGIVYGQWWTLWVVFWAFVWGSTRPNPNYGLLMLAAVFLAVLFAFTGCVLGVLIGAVFPSDDMGGIFGMVAGFLLLILQVLITRSILGVLVNAIFWFFSGRYVGTHIARKVEQPLIL